MIPSPICAAAPIELAFSAIQVAKVLPTGIVVVPKSTASKVSRFSPSVKDANVFVISHKTGMEDKFENHIKFEKVKGFSRIES